MSLGTRVPARRPLPVRSTLAHELVHDLGLDHTTFAAGPFTPPPYAHPPLGSCRRSPLTLWLGSVIRAIRRAAANLMTTGSLRTEPTVVCVLAPGNDAIDVLYTARASKVQCRVVHWNGRSGDHPIVWNSSTQLPMSQQPEVLTGMSGLLSPPTCRAGSSTRYRTTTTKAQLGTGGSSTDPVTSDLSGPAGGKPGETLVAWVLTLPAGADICQTQPIPRRLPISEGPRPGRQLLPGHRK